MLFTLVLCSVIAVECSDKPMMVIDEPYDYIPISWDKMHPSDTLWLGEPPFDSTDLHDYFTYEYLRSIICPPDPPPNLIPILEQPYRDTKCYTAMTALEQEALSKH